MKIRFFECAITIFMIMMVSVVQAEHSKRSLEITPALEQVLQELFGVMDAFPALAYGLYKDELDEEIIKLTRDRVANDFKDPDSAKFRNERVFRTKDGIYVCGEVNAKNSFGAYVGYSDYLGVPFWVELEDEDNESYFIYIILHYCFRE